MMHLNIAAYIFDVDGLLLDTEGVFDEVTQKFSEKVTGNRIPQDTFLAMRAKMFGGTAEHSEQLLFKTIGHPEFAPNTYIAWRKPLVEEGLRSVDLLPGAEKLIRHLAAHGTLLAISTSSNKALHAIKTQRHHELFSLIPVVVTSDDISKGKPAPDGFLQAAKDLHADPSACLVFEDAPNGVESARTAGMHIIAVPHPLLNKSLVADADQILNSLEDFTPEQWGLPPY